MSGDRKFKMAIPVLGGVFLSLFLLSCAEVQVQTISPPPPSAKLRVWVLPLTGAAPLGGWETPHAQFANRQWRAIRQILEATGIYEMPRREEVRAAIGNQIISPVNWKANQWATAKRVGRALFAEYIMTIERDYNKGIRFYQTSMINLETGKQFKVSLRVPVGPEHREEWQSIAKVAYAEIFKDAKSDMLATSLRKTRRSSGSQPFKTEEPLPEAAPPRQVEFVTPQREESSPPRIRVAVYDLSASDPFKIAALILSEGLREELFRLGNFTLVNRENLATVLNEMGLQQTGLIDEKQAIQAGKGLAAGQIVLGQLGSLGNTLVLNVKRVDVETQTTVSLGSIKCSIGKEEELLAGLPALARKLAGKP